MTLFLIGIGIGIVLASIYWMARFYQAYDREWREGNSYMLEQLKRHFQKRDP